MNKHLARTGLLTALLAMTFLLLFMAAGYAAADSTAVLETSSLRVTLKMGAVVGIENRLTGESYLTPGAIGRAVGLLRTEGESYFVQDVRTFDLRERSDGVDFALFRSTTRRDSIVTYARIEQATGDILIWQAGGHRRDGTYGARFGFADFDLDAGQLVLPVEGGIAIGKDASFVEETRDYSVDWQAQLAIFEGHTGALGIWFEDSEFLPKKITLKRQLNTVGVSFETHNLGDFDARSKVFTPVIRLRAFAGDWRQPAGAYRVWMQQNLDPLERSEHPAWTDSIACYVIHRASDVTVTLDSLARWLPPRQVLIYVPDWRTDGFDINYPEYTPAEHSFRFVERAKELGFRVMLHTNPFGIAPYHASFDDFADAHFINPFNGNLIGWLLETESPERHAWFNPASPELQNLFLQKVGSILDALAVDALQLDVNYAAWNTDNAVLNGETPGMGNRTFHRRLTENFPEIVWGGENLTEINFYRNSFASRWRTDHKKWRPHPVASFLFNGHTTPVGFLGFVNPDRDPDLFEDYMRSYENWGVLPTLDVSGLADLLGPGTQDIIRIASTWARLGLKPDFDSDWDDETLFRLKGRNGEIAEYRLTPSGTFFVVQGDTLLNRLAGVNRIRTTLAIDGWFGYNQQEIIGLNPQVTYQLENRSRDLNAPHIQQLTEDAIISFSSTDGKGGRFIFDHSGASSAVDLVARLAEAVLEIRKRGTVEPIGDGAFVRAEQITIDGVTRSGLATHPPFIGGAGEVLISYTVTIPDADDARLNFFAGLDEDAAAESDGVAFFVDVDGATVFDTLVEDAQWTEHTVDLAAWRGQQVVLTLGNGPGPDNNVNFDQGRWGDVLILSTVQPEFEAEIYLPGPATIEGDGELTQIEPNVYRLSGRLPAQVAFAAHQPETELPVRLLPRLRKQFGLAKDGLFLAGESVFGSGEVGGIEAGGELRVAISAHPPAEGQTIIHDSMTLPLADTLALAGAYGLADGAQSTGVTFSIYINGDMYFSTTTADTGWQPFSLDLTPFAGEAVYLQFVTDAGQSSAFDWAYWTDLVVCNDPADCSDCVHDGDVNGDGQLTEDDAFCAFSFYLQGQRISQSCDAPGFTCELAAADVNCDAVVSVIDALAIFVRALEQDTPAACFLPSAPIGNGPTGPVLLSLQRAGQTPESLRLLLSAEAAAGVRAFGLDFVYPADKLVFKSVRATGLLSDWAGLDASQTEPGLLAIGGFNDLPLPEAASGGLFEIEFEVQDSAFQFSELAITNFSDDFSNASYAITEVGHSIDESSLPTSFQLYQNYPNPFNPETRIRFDLPARTQGAVAVHLAIYNITGQLVRVLVDAERAAGAYDVVWDGRNARGLTAPSGLYFFRLRAGEFTRTNKMLLIR